MFLFWFIFWSLFLANFVGVPLFLVWCASNLFDIPRPAPKIRLLLFAVFAVMYWQAWQAPARLDATAVPPAAHAPGN